MRIERRRGIPVVIMGGTSGIGLATAERLTAASAEAIRYLPDATYLTGTILPVDGGLTMA